MRSGMQMGMRSGLLSGLNARWTPQTADEFAAALPAVTAPDGLWLFDEASGDFLDRIGSNDFSVSAGTVTRGVATPFGPGITLADSNARLTVTSTSFMDAGTATDISSLIVCRPPASPAASTTFIHKRLSATPFDGWQNWMTTAGAVVAEGDGDDAGDPTDLAALSTDHRGRWSPIIFTIDWGQIRVDTQFGGASATLDVGDTTSIQPLTVGARGSAHASGVHVAFVACWDGYALTATERQILRDFFA